MFLHTKTRAHGAQNVTALTRRQLLLALLSPAVAISSPSPTFIDITARSGVRFKHDASHTSQKYLPEAMGGGVAMFDYDGDGRLDLFFVNGAAIQDPMLALKSEYKSEPIYCNPLSRNNSH